MSKRLLRARVILVLLLGLLFSDKMYASHLAAAEIFVDYIGTCPGDSSYRVTLNVYRFCSAASINMSSPQIITITDTVTNTTFNYSVDNGSTFNIVAALCPTYFAQNSCYNNANSNIYPGFEKWTFIAYLDGQAGLNHFPKLSRSYNWLFSWTNSARFSGILNLGGAASSGYSIYVDCHINNKFRLDISTPHMSIDADAYMCINQLNHYANGPVDPDGDSIVTSIAAPLQGYNSPCYATGYSPTPTYTMANPMGSSTPFNVNPNTGVATFTPIAQGPYVLAFIVNKYDRASHQLIGHMRRDLQTYVLPCSAPPPVTDPSPTISSGYNDNGTIVVCPYAVDSFVVGGHSPTPGATLYLRAEGLPGNSTFTVPTTGPNAQGGQNPIGTFMWNTPTNCDIGLHQIRIVVLDSSCTGASPILAQTELAVNVNVIPGVQAYPKTYTTCKFSPPIYLNASGLSSFNYQWNDLATGNTFSIISGANTATPAVKPQYNTQYVVHVPSLDAIQGCRSRDTVTVLVDTSTHVKISPSPVVMCKPGLLELTANGSGMHPLTNPTCKLPYTTPVPNTTLDSTNVTPIGAKLNLCSTNDSIVVPFGGLNTERHQYLVRAQDMLNSGMKPGTIKAITFNVTSYTPGQSVFYGVKVYMKCTTQPLNSNGTPTSMAAGDQVASFTSITVNSNGDLYIPLTTDYNPATQKYFDWDTSQNILIDICYDDIGQTVSSPRTAFASYFNTTYPACIYQMSCGATATYCGSQVSVASPIYELPKIRFTYYYSQPNNFLYYWTTAYGDKLIADTTVQTAKIYVTHNSKYYAFTQGLGGCVVADSVNVTMDNPPAWGARPKDTSICWGSTTMLWAMNGVKYAWYENGSSNPATTLKDNNGLACDNCATPFATPTDTTIYDVVITDANNCTDTVYLTVNTIPLPVFHVLDSAITIKYGSSVQLGVNTSIYSYIWTPISTLDDPYKTNPVAYPAQPTVYVVTGFTGSCSTSDTVIVNIDYGANLFVPSAFTPNGDGQNDLFRVGNLTFQKVIEFRILNRWGNEVFQAVDNHGWDGSWNGVQQDIGIYFYLIRVESLDGTMQTFQGNVTLIR